MTLRNSPSPARSIAVAFFVGLIVGAAAMGVVTVACWERAMHALADLDECTTDACAVCGGGR